MRRKLRAIEIGIFSILALVVMNSTYSLVMGRIHDGPSTSKNGSRTPASEAGADCAINTSSTLNNEERYEKFDTYYTSCNGISEPIQTHASKLRISGPLCSAYEPKVHNQTTNYEATVFIDRTTRQYSTDYIPIESGNNVITLIYVKPNSFGGGAERQPSSQKTLNIFKP